MSTGEPRQGPHVCAVIIDGYDNFWAFCDDCLFRLGPYTDEVDAQITVFWHEEYTRPPGRGGGER